FGARFIQMLGPMDLIDGKLLDNGTRATLFWTNGADKKSGIVSWNGRSVFNRSVEIFPDRVTLTSSLNYSVGNLGNSSYVKISGPTASFSISSLKVNEIGEGSRRTVYNMMSSSMVIKHQ